MTETVHAESDTASAVLSFLDSLRGAIQARLPETCTWMHIKTLGAIEADGEPSMKDVAAKLNITSPGATMVVDKLVEEGEISRESDPGDRRVVRLKLTAKGRASLQKGMKAIREAIDGALDVLTDEERRGFSAALRRLASAYKRS